MVGKNNRQKRKKITDKNIRKCMKNMEEKRKFKVTEKKHRWDNDLYQAENYMEQKIYASPLFIPQFLSPHARDKFYPLVHDFHAKDTKKQLCLWFFFSY